MSDRLDSLESPSSPADLWSKYRLLMRDSAPDLTLWGREEFHEPIWQASCKFSDILDRLTSWEPGDACRNWPGLEERRRSCPSPTQMLSVVSLLLELATEKEITCALVYRKLPRKKGAWAEIMCFWSCKINKGSFSFNPLDCWAP